MKRFDGEDEGLLFLKSVSVSGSRPPGAKRSAVMVVVVAEAGSAGMRR